MKHLEFITLVDEVRPHLKGERTSISRECGIHVKEYDNIISGKIKNPDVLAKTTEAIEKVLRAKLQDLKQKVVTLFG